MPSASPSANTSTESQPKEIRVDADLLIPGRGDPIQSASLIYSPNPAAGGTGTIVWAGKTASIPHQHTSLPTQEHVPVLIPGLWDSHVHYFGRADPNIENLALLHLALAGVRSARDIAATLNAGYTSVREVGGNGAELAKAVNEGWVPGPNIYAAVAPISQTAGHGDLHTMPLELLRDRIRHGFPLWICDGVDNCINAVRTQIRRGAKVIKVHATGGVMSRIDSPMAPQFSAPELKAMVEEANKAGLLVAAHCHGKVGIMNALRAGVKTIEHGSYLDEEAIGLMKEKDAMLVATRTILAVGLTHPKNMAPESYKKLVEVADAHKKSYAAAVKTSPLSLSQAIEKLIES